MISQRTLALPALAFVLLAGCEDGFKGIDPFPSGNGASQWIYFNENLGGNPGGGISAIRADGTGYQTLGHEYAVISSSPVGGKIAIAEVGSPLRFMLIADLTNGAIDTVEGSSGDNLALNLMDSALVMARTGERVAYATRGAVVVARTDGSIVQRAMPKYNESPLRLMGAPVFSPDGERLALTALVDGKTEWNIGLFLFDIASGKVTMIDSNVCGGYPGIVDWSPPGDALAYIHWVDENRSRNEIVIANLKTGERSVAEGRFFYTALAWSPDRTRLAVIGGDSAFASCDLWVLDLGTRTAVNLTEGTPRSECNPQWSPDGTMILCSSFLRDYGMQEPVELKVVDVASRRAVTLSENSFNGYWAYEKSSRW